MRPFAWNCWIFAFSISLCIFSMASLTMAPTELIREISTYLDLADICTLAKSHPVLNSKLLGSPSFCRDLVQKLIPRSYEAQLANSSFITYRKALINTFQRRNAFANCRPYSLHVLESISDYLYEDGCMVFLRGRMIHIQPVHSTQDPVTIDLDLTFSRGAQQAFFRLVRYCCGILVVRVRTPRGQKLAVFNASQVRNMKAKPILMITVPPSRIEIVRNDSNRVVIATFRGVPDGIGSAWEFLVYSLHGLPPQQLTEVGNFGTSEIGSTIVVELLHDHLWIISSQLTHDPEGPDPLNYYGGCCVFLGHRENDAENVETLAPGQSTSTDTNVLKPNYFRILRRRQREGPIHDGWTTLSLSCSESWIDQIPVVDQPVSTDLESIENDEAHESSHQTNFLDSRLIYIITETRTEWLPSIGNPIRSFYTTTFVPFANSDAFVTKMPPPTRSELHLTPLERLVKISEATDLEEYVETMLSDVYEKQVCTFKGCREWWPETFLPGRDPYGDAKQLTQEPTNNFGQESFRLPQFVYRIFEPSSSSALDIISEKLPNRILRLQTCANREPGVFPPRSMPPNSDMERLFLGPTHNQTSRIFSDERTVTLATGSHGKETYSVTIVNFDPLLSSWHKFCSPYSVDTSAVVSIEEDSLGLMRIPRLSDGSSLGLSTAPDTRSPKRSRASTARGDTSNPYDLTLDGADDGKEDTVLEGYQSAMENFRANTRQQAFESSRVTESKRKRGQSSGSESEEWDLGLTALGLRMP